MSASFGPHSQRNLYRIHTIRSYQMSSASFVGFHFLSSAPHMQRELKMGTWQNQAKPLPCAENATLRQSGGLGGWWQIGTSAPRAATHVSAEPSGPKLAPAAPAAARSAHTTATAPAIAAAATCSAAGGASWRAVRPQPPFQPASHDFLRFCTVSYGIFCAIGLYGLRTGFVRASRGMQSEL